MSFWEKVTGSDLSREYQGFEARARVLPTEYQTAWEQIKIQLAPYGDFSGRNLMPILDGVLGLLEETAADGQRVGEAVGDDIAGFCAAIAGEEGVKSFREKWREELNDNVARKLGRLGA
ncbi:DUF1048 domain-containing protein [Nocardia acidivorans]|uniref:DUF1048 domain-containing protein n=1 Tax=Nocardia acidivorans TaxID=404580 RepID=UPI00082ACB4F|nr:DUF1048 domain-containing protein [Nocardia acidivorans]